ncbi:DUF5058 family protein [Candidatus Latescibacterota bacterium]
MENYLSIANGTGMWIACSAIIVVVFVQAIRLTIISFRSGASLGIPRESLVQALRTGFISALVPSIAILVGVAVLIPRLGVPFPWMRLSVIGSVIYELFAIEIAANTMGLTDSTAAFSGEVFSLAVWTMSMGFIFCLLFVAFFTPHMKKIKDRIAGDDVGWMSILNSAAFFGAFGFLWGQPIARGGFQLIALVGGFICMVMMQLLIRYGRQTWLKEWALSISIIAGMTAMGIAHHYQSTGG